MSYFTDHMTAHTTVQHPETGEMVEWGTLSSQQQAQWLAEDAATDNYINQIAETGSYRNNPTVPVPPAYVTGPMNESGGSYNVQTGYQQTALENVDVPVSATATQTYTESPNFNATTTWTGGGYDPDYRAGGYDPVTGYTESAGNSLGGQAAVTEGTQIGADFRGGYYGDQVEPSGGGYDPSVAGLEDPTNQRPGSKIADVANGGVATEPSISFKRDPGADNANMEDDWRVRISLSRKLGVFYNDAKLNTLMAPLKKTDGVVFPYTPNITVTHAAQYNATSPTHSNYAQLFYNNSEVQDITIDGEFTVQNIEEGQYLMAAVYFFRSATKMFFGSGENVGNPPPVVFLDGYGQHYFPHVPCVITSFSHTLTAEVDYIEVPLSSAIVDTGATATNGPNLYDNGAGGLTSNRNAVAPNFQTPGTRNAVNTATQITSKTRVPTFSKLAVTLKPIYSRKNLHDRFDLNKFAAGGLLRDKNTGFGGFL